MSKFKKKNILSYKNVSYSIERFKLVDINFSIKKSEIVALFGYSGSGKTTIINCLLNNMEYSGEIFLDGKNTKETTEKEFLTKIYFIDQDANNNLNSLNCPSNIFEEVRQIRNKPHDEWNKIVSSLYKIFSLKEENLYKNISFHSVGQKQRISIIKGILLNPKILVLDESLSALDQKTKSDIINFLVFWKSMTKKTVFIVTHDIKDLFFCDRILFLKNSSIKISSGKNQAIDNLKEFYDEDTIKFFS